MSLCHVSFRCLSVVCSSTKETFPLICFQINNCLRPKEVKLSNITKMQRKIRRMYPNKCSRTFSLFYPIYHLPTSQIYPVTLSKQLKLPPPRSATKIKCCLCIYSSVLPMLNLFNESQHGFLQNQYFYFNTLSKFS